MNVALGETETLLQKEGGEKKNLEISFAKTEAELNAKIAIGEKDIAVLKSKIEEVCFEYCVSVKVCFFKSRGSYIILKSSF